MSRRSKFAKYRVNLLKYYAEQLMLPRMPERSEPHKIVVCCKCSSKDLDFHTNGDGEQYYVCRTCSFESEPLGLAPFPRTGF